MFTYIIPLLRKNYRLTGSKILSFCEHEYINTLDSRQRAWNVVRNGSEDLELGLCVPGTIFKKLDGIRVKKDGLCRNSGN